VALE